jgi:hypothetical protein
MPTATLCHCQTQAILPGQSLDALRQQEQEQAARLQQQGAVSVLTAYDPRQWQLLRVSAWRSEQDFRQQETDGACYRIGYVATGS